MRKNLWFLLTIIALLSLLFVPVITKADSKYTVTLYYMDTNNNKPVHTSIIKDVTGGTKINLSNYEYDLAKKFKVYGYSYSNTTMNDQTLSNKQVTVNSDIQAYLNYSLSTDYKYVVRYFTAYKNGNSYVKVKNVKVDSIKSWGSSNSISVTASDVEGASYKGYALTYNGLGKVSTSSMNSLNTNKTATVSKANNFSFVCIDFFFEVSAESTNVVTKSSSWDDTNKTKVKTEIKVTPVKAPPIADSDIMVVFDRSGTSVGHWVTMNDAAILGKDTEEKGKEHSGTVAKMLKEINIGGNTVSYIAYSSRLFAFNKKGLVFASDHRYAPGLGYSKSWSSAKDYVKTSGNEAAEKATLYKSMVDNYGAEIREWMKTSLNDQIEGAVKFQNSIKDSQTSATSWGGAIRINYNNTNFDLPLMFSQYYFSQLYKDGQNGRKSYILFITDAMPYPNDASVRGRIYKKIKDANGWGTGAYEGILWDGDNAGNKYYSIIAEELRKNYNTEIYMIIMPNSSSSDLVKSLTNTDGYSENANKNTNDHVAIVTDGLEGTQLVNAIKSALDKILSKMEMSSSSSYYIEDYINDEILKDGSSITYECYVGGSRNKDEEKNVTISGNKVTWNFTGYINSLGNNATVPEFKLVIYSELKDEFKNGTIEFNTNKIDGEFDNTCTFSYPGGSDEVTTPWLEKQGGRIRVNWLVVDDNGKVIKTIKTEDRAVAYGKGTVNQNECDALLPRHEYKGSKYTKGISTPTQRPASLDGAYKVSYNSTQEDPDHTIDFYYTYKKISCTVSYRHIAVDGNGNVVKTFSGSGYYLGCKQSPNPIILKNDNDGNPIAQDYSVTKKMSNTTYYKYDRYYVGEGKIFTSESEAIATGKDEKVTVKLSESSKDYTITFIYLRLDITNPSVEVVHHVVTEPEREIFSGAPGFEDKRVKINFSKFLDYYELTPDEVQSIYDIFSGSGNISDKIRTSLSKLSGKSLKKTMWLKSIGSYIMGENRMRIKDVNVMIRQSEYALGNTGYTSLESRNTTDGGKIFTEVSLLAKLASNVAGLQFFNAGDNLISIKYDYAEQRTMTVKHVDIFTGEVIEFDGKKYQDSTDFDKGSLQTAKAHTEGKDIFGGYTFINKYDISDPSLVTKVNDDKSEVTMKMDKDLEITFYYNKIPEIDGKIFPENSPVIGGIPDPNDPEKEEVGNPYKTQDASKLITLDEIFSLDVYVENYNRITTGSKIECTMPFDVYYFGNTNKTGTNGKFLAKGTKLVIEDVGNVASSSTTKTFKLYFRLPSWVVEKLLSDANPYEALLHIEDTVNQPWIEDKTIRIGVVGKLYDFTVTNINEGTINYWRTSLFTNNNLRREYKADTLPIGQRLVTPNISNVFDKAARNNNTQPTTWKYGMMLGGKFYFSINTKGIKSDSIKIVPKLYYYDANGVKQNVTFNYIDSNNAKVQFANDKGVIVAKDGAYTASLNDSFRTSSPEVVLEIKKANEMKALNNVLNIANGNALLGYRSLANQYSNFSHLVPRNTGKYNMLLIPSTLRMPYINYAKGTLDTAEVNKIGFTTYNKTSKTFNNTPELQYVDNGRVDAITKNNEYLGNTKAGILGINEDALVNSLGHWYAEYYLPRTLEVVDSSKNVVKGGSIVVAFKIATKDKEGFTYLSYNKASNDSGQWKVENADIASEKVKINLPASDKTVDFTIQDGYYPVAVYSTDRIEKDIDKTH